MGKAAVRGESSPSHHRPALLEPPGYIRMGKRVCADLPGCQKHFWSTACCLLPGSELCRAGASHATACKTLARFAGCSCFRPAFSCPSQLLDPGPVPQAMLGPKPPVCDGEVVQRSRLLLRRPSLGNASPHRTHPAHHPRSAARAVPAGGKMTDH